MSLVSMHETQELEATRASWLTAVGARLWVTRQGDPDDHVLAPGERLAVDCGDRLVLGPWDSGERAAWVWEARDGQRCSPAYGWRRRLVGRPLEAVARGLRGAGLGAFARRAAPTAS